MQDGHFFVDFVPFEFLRGLLFDCNYRILDTFFCKLYVTDFYRFVDYNIFKVGEYLLLYLYNRNPMYFQL